MASGMYNIGRQGLIDGTIDMDTNTIKIALIKDTETFDETDTTMTGPGANRLGIDQTLGTITVTAGVFDAADPTWTAVAGGSTIHGAIVFKYGTNDAGSTPICFIDLTDTATNGGDITINFDTGANKVFALNG